MSFRVCQKPLASDPEQRCIKRCLWSAHTFLHNIEGACGVKHEHSTTAPSFAAWLRVGVSEQNAVLVRVGGNDLSRSHQNDRLYKHKSGWRHLKRFFVLPQLHGWAILSQVELGTSWGTTQFPAYCESIFRLLLKIAVGWGTRCVYINFWNHYFFNQYKNETRLLPNMKHKR